MSETFTFILNTSFGLVLALCSVQSTPVTPPTPAPPAIQYECAATLPNPLNNKTNLVFIAAGTLTGPYLEAADSRRPIRYPHFANTQK